MLSSMMLGLQEQPYPMNTGCTAREFTLVRCQAHAHIPSHTHSHRYSLERFCADRATATLPLQQLTFTGTRHLTSHLHSKQSRNRKQHLACSDPGICFPHDTCNFPMTSEPFKFLLRLSRSIMEPRVSKMV